MKKKIRKISINPVVRGIVRLAVAFLGFSSRAWSRLRFSALVTNAENSVCHWSTEIKYPENIELGNHVVIGPQCCLGAKSPIRLGDYVRLSRGVIIDTGRLDMNADLPYPHQSKPISIGKGAWLATNAIIVGGVTIGEFAVIGAGAVITKDVAARTLVIGSPTRVLEVRKATTRS